MNSTKTEPVDKAANDSRSDLRRFVVKLLIIALFVVLIAACWALRHLIMMVVGAIVLAVPIRALADRLERIPGVSERISSVLTMLLLAAGLAALAWSFGRQAADQFAQLGDAIPRAWSDLTNQISSWPGGEWLVGSIEASAGEQTDVLRRFGLLLVELGNAMTSFVLIVFGAAFFSAQPKLYRTGLVKLIPYEKRDLANDVLDDSGRALKLWLGGQLISMAVVGLLTGVLMWIAGVPAPLALGIISGLTEGIPYIGPIIAAAPGLLLGLSVDVETALWALAIYVLVQQIEGNTLVPLIQRKTVSLPPVLTLFSVIAGGILFGLLGLVFAVPMLVILFVAVKRLYVRETLETPTPIPGEKDEE